MNKDKLRTDNKDDQQQSTKEVEKPPHVVKGIKKGTVTSTAQNNIQGDSPPDTDTRRTIDLEVETLVDSMIKERDKALEQIKNHQLDMDNQNFDA